MNNKAHAGLSAFVEHLSPGSSGRGRHSPLFRYLYHRAEAFKRVLEETRPSWDAITEALAKEGLTNGDGQPLTRRRVQKTWYAVWRAKSWTKQGRLEPAPVPAHAPARKPPAVEDDEPPPARTFSTAVLRNHVPAVASPALPAQPKQQPEPDPDRASRVIEALMSGAPRNKFRTDDGE